MNRNTVLLGGGLLAILIILGVTDAVLMESEKAPADQEPEEIVAEEPTTPTPPTVGVRKQTGPDVLTVLETQGFEAIADGNKMLLPKLIPEDEAAVHEYALLKDGDRAGALSWTSGPQVKIYFLSLKEALHSSFSPDLTDLIDEKQQRKGMPTRDLLSFLDPGISEERITFVRVRERLYEVHIAEGMDEALFALIERLTE